MGTDYNTEYECKKASDRGFLSLAFLALMHLYLKERRMEELYERMVKEELYETNGENLFNRGKVRDVYEMSDGKHLIIITTDRISAYDCVFPNSIPGKGVYLNRLTNFWLDFLKVRNHRVSMSEVPEDELEDFLGMEEEIQDRMMVVRKAEPFPVEVVIRGYLAGSGWKEYQEKGTVCGQILPEGLREGEEIPDGPILTPATKAQEGEHDENIATEEAAEIVGAPWGVIVGMALDIYQRAAQFALMKGIIIADTKFEFGMVDGEVTLIDEVLTPDSSRFWPKDEYRVGETQKSYDKQFVRDWLTGTGWKDGEVLPNIPKLIVAATIDKYKTLSSILTT